MVSDKNVKGQASAYSYASTRQKELITFVSYKASKLLCFNAFLAMRNDAEIRHRSKELLFARLKIARKYPEP